MPRISDLRSRFSALSRHYSLANQRFLRSVAVTLFNVQLLVSFAMILTSAVVSIFYHTWCSALCLNPGA